MSRKGKIDLLSKKEFKTLVYDSSSIREILKKLKYKNLSGTMHTKIKTRIVEDGLSTKHMSSIFGRHNGKRNPIETILVENSTYGNITRLKIRLVNEDILKYECDECDNNGYWGGKNLTLQLDHKNGINNDHRIENLRFLCPNCHSQTDTFAGKNINKNGST